MSDLRFSRVIGSLAGSLAYGEESTSHAWDTEDDSSPHDEDSEETAEKPRIDVEQPQGSNELVVFIGEGVAKETPATVILEDNSAASQFLREVLRSETDSESMRVTDTGGHS